MSGSGEPEARRRMFASAARCEMASPDLIYYRKCRPKPINNNVYKESYDTGWKCRS